MDYIVKIIFRIPENELIPVNSLAKQWSILFELYIDMETQMEFKGNFTDELINKFDLTQYSFCQQFLKVCGGDSVTRYISNHIGRQTTEILKKYRNFWIYSQTAMEAKVGSLRGCLFNQMNLGSGKQLYNNFD